MRELCKNVNIPLFSACCFFFHFANAAVLPLLGQYAAIVGPHVPIGVAPHGHVAPMLPRGMLTRGRYVAIVGDARGGLPYTAANIAIAQSSATFFAWAMGKMIDRGYGYRLPVFIGFGSLPVRCGVILALVYAWPNPYALIATQIIDGVGAGASRLPSSLRPSSCGSPTA